MDCHCHDHLPGEWHDKKECDCHKHENPTYTFVVTKVTDEDPGSATVFISQDFMEKLDVSEGDPVEVVDSGGFILRARTHPNPWIETRMVSLDQQSLDRLGYRLFSQIKLRKTVCDESSRVTLRVPSGVSITRLQLQSMIDRADGAIVAVDGEVILTGKKGEKVRFTVVDCEPADTARVTKRTRIRLVDADGEEYISKRDTTFADVGGLDDAIRKVREVVQLPLAHPEIFRRLGVDPPRGVLLHGPSGTGKTLIARAVAGETGCYFKAVSGTEIMDKYYGESEAKLRAAFEEAQDNAPAIVFIDEIDALAPGRDTAEGDVERRVTAQLLALMDGLEDRGEVIVLGATNLPNTLDRALRRAGRFDREIFIGVPDKNGRHEILEIHARDMPVEGADLWGLAEKTHGFVGADLRALCREAGYKALRRILPGLEDTEETLSQDFLDAIKVETEDFEFALKDMRPSSARKYDVDLRKAGWDKICGYEPEIEFLNEMVLWPLQNISYLSELGVNHLTGLVITGPSGVGKTLMARSVAKESGFNVIEIRGPELISKYMGESERNVRELFRQAKELAPTVVILDGVDAMTSSGWSDSKVIDRVVNQLALEMNSISADQPVLVAAVCVNGNDLPPALRATGRFGTELPLKLPGAEDRLKLFRRYLERDRVTFTGDLAAVEKAAEGLAAGDIEEVCRRVVLQAARCAQADGTLEDCRVVISEDDALKALDRRRLVSRFGGRS